MNIKQKFPDEVRVRQHIHTHAAEYLATLSAKLAHQEAAYRKSLDKNKQGNRFVTSGGALLVGTFYLFNTIGEGYIDVTWWLIVMMIAGVIAGAVLVLKGVNKRRDAQKNINQFNQGVNEELFPVALSIFGIDADWLPHSKMDTEQFIANWEDTQKNKSVWKRDLLSWSIQALESYISPEQRQVKSLLDHSELITESANKIVVDDMVQGKIYDRNLFISELHARHETRTGKGKVTKEIFKGYFVSFDLPRALEGKTFISTEGDTKGFGNQSFFNNLRGHEVQPISLEWNEFENLLHVVTSHPSEARYILTPNFMADLYDWWVTKKANIRISFIDNRLYILFPDQGIQFKHTINMLTEPSVERYLASIAIPLLHVLHLIEDVESNMR